MPPLQRCLASGLAGMTLGAAAWADPTVALVATADPAYTQRKYENGEVKTEHYVFAEGTFFRGSIVDRSIDGMTFRRLVGYLAPHLAKQQYLPTPELEAADLLLVVHWGTTLPRVSTREMTAWVSNPQSNESFLMDRHKGVVDGQMTGIGANGSPDTSFQLDDTFLLPTGHEQGVEAMFDELEQVTDRLADASRYRSNVSLLGYGRTMRNVSGNPWQSEEERTLRHDINTERYFIIVEAYDLPALRRGERSRDPLWKMHINIATPGNNFRTAMSRMSVAAVDFFGRSTEGVETRRARIPEGEVTIEPIIILGEVE